MIDIHAHLLPPDLPDFAAEYGTPGWPVLTVEGSTGAIRIDGHLYRTVDERYWSAARRLEYLDGHGIDRQVISPLPVLLPRNATDGATEMAKWLNAAVGTYVDRHPDRLSGFGTVAFDTSVAASAALDDVVGNGLCGIELPTFLTGSELSDGLRQDFFFECAERGLPVLIHPTDQEVIPRLTSPALHSALGITTDTAVAAFALLMADVFDRAPTLRLCLSHGGGALFWILPRLCCILGAERGARIRAAARNFWVDSASLDPVQVSYLLNFVDADKLLLGSDFPAAISDPRMSFADLQTDTGAGPDPCLAFLAGAA